MIYSFILGQNSTLSCAEIFSKLHAEKINFSVLSISAKAAILNLETELEKPRLFLNSLGGTIKLVQIIKQVDLLIQNFKQALDEIFPPFPETKFIFGFSAYGFDKKFNQYLNKLAIQKKKEYSSIKISSRYVSPQKESALTSVQIVKNQILEKGMELVFIKTLDGIYLGKTLAVQDFEAYNLRDYGRPYPNPYSGMLPPKVAQIMVNLTGLTAESSPTRHSSLATSPTRHSSLVTSQPTRHSSLVTSQPTRHSSLVTRHLIYDPFCGVGTILQEAMLLGFEAVGSDIDESEVKKCRSNISWLIKKFKLGEKDLEKSIFVHDISSSPPKILVDAIVTEPYLGKPLKKIPSPLEAKKIIAELVPLYEKALSNYKKILKPNGKIVMIFPKIGSFRSIQNLKIAKIGLKLLNPIPDFVKEKYFFSFKDLSDTNTIFYARPDAKIIREIAVLSIA